MTALDQPTASAPLDLPGWRHAYSGKVRDLYVPAAPAADAATPDLDAASRVLVVASDRVSAFDHVLEPGIPGKGVLLTTLSLWWFGQLAGIPNHLLADAANTETSDRADTAVTHGADGIPAAVAGRAMLCKTLDMFPIECVVRGYLTGSGWKQYQVSQTVCGLPLPAGLQNGDRLPEPIYTPAWKAPMGEHDENISFERTVELVGADVAAELRRLSLEIFRRASVIAEKSGVILADTKFEFGADRATGEITLADEVLTSDSSRYWDAALWQTGTTPEQRMSSFDKQIVRDWLSAHWDQTGTPPALPEDIIERTAARYRELLTRLAGTDASA
ncbi:phosphoribosylaminoimidazolesuccinocarboxamide synthase [Cryobacterium algoricola]|uniref:Phosphoribosylaminoimidazole-succinocarboxamide synthase n=1 Tax=Cryobacterium algoricola TaxID=1259183 RepID=A0ABY2IIH2_9MICO|nr:phosphoribosylaminoimidazolesuccinocarboxamide synthase [Cryobacterium algoricola]TFB89023.1 phosphoribosylaminoimidazolesuccinocarboxamide synthase [Cryobacterium algoricola]